MRPFQYNVGVLAFPVALVLTCSPEAPQQATKRTAQEFATKGTDSSPSGLETEKGPETEQSTVQKYGDIRPAPLEDDFSAIEDEVKRSQAIADKTFKGFASREGYEVTDHFYKCGMRLSHLHFKMKSRPAELQVTDASFKILTENMEKFKVGKFEAYSAYRLPNETMFLAFLNKDGKVYYVKKTSTDTAWIDPLLLADFKGSPVIKLNDEQVVEIVVYRTSNGQVYTYTWNDSAFESSGDGVSSSLTEFESIQERAGVEAEILGVTQFSVSPKPPEEKKDFWWVIKEGGTRLFMGLLTFGTSELATLLNDMCELRKKKEIEGYKCTGLDPTLVDKIKSEVCK
ncbi:MAG: hypothetical protein HYW48_11880 [Deltaproteobacteria bacterium]|nr:hypothetical protein [Deltaproteobacteria bacterium]